MKMVSVIKSLVKDNSINSIFKTIFKEKNEGRLGISITKLSKKTGIEGHKLVGILEVLAVLGLLVIFEIGMAKAIAPSPMLLKVKDLIRL